MNNDDYIKLVKAKLNDNSKKYMLNQIDKYYDAKEYKNLKCKYSVG